MRDYLNPHTLANDARMRRALFKGAFLFVEGQLDEKLYGMFVEDSRCQIIIAHDRSRVLGACQVLESASFPGAIGIIDADFDILEAKTPGVATVFQTDLHDAECLMLSTHAFDKLLFQFASKEKLAAWKAAHGPDVRYHLLCEAALIGCLVWHSNREKLNLLFEGLEAKEFVDATNLKLDLNLFVRHVKNKSSRHDLSGDMLINGIQERRAAAQDLWQAVRGHDFIDCLAFALRKTLANCPASMITRERLELDLRLAYPEEEFFRTRLFAQVRAWEASQGSFRVFRKPRQTELEL